MSSEKIFRQKNTTLTVWLIGCICFSIIGFSLKELNLFLFSFAGILFYFFVLYPKLKTTFEISTMDLTQKSTYGEIEKNLLWADIKFIQSYNIFDEKKCELLHLKKYEATAPKDLFAIPSTIINFHSFVQQIILHVHPSCIVDEKILTYFNITRSDIGKLFGKPIE